jgi:hypothetical protein
MTQFAQISERIVLMDDAISTRRPRRMLRRINRKLKRETRSRENKPFDAADYFMRALLCLRLHKRRREYDHSVSFAAQCTNNSPALEFEFHTGLLLLALKRRRWREVDSQYSFLWSMVDRGTGLSDGHKAIVLTLDGTIEATRGNLTAAYVRFRLAKKVWGSAKDWGKVPDSIQGLYRQWRIENNFRMLRVLTPRFLARMKRLKPEERARYEAWYRDLRDSLTVSVMGMRVVRMPKDPHPTLLPSEDPADRKHVIVTPGSRFWSRRARAWLISKGILWARVEQVVRPRPV